MTPISIFKNATSTEPINTTIESILDKIKSGYWSDKITHLRSLDKAQYDEQKKLLPAVTFTGTFKKRENTDLDKYSGIVCLDIDKLELSQVANLKNQFKDDPRILADFISPSGKGLKILVKVNTGAENHLSAFLHLQKVFEQDYCFKIDDSGKDLARLCFVSYDPEININSNSNIFEVDIRYGAVKKYTVPSNLQNYKPEADTKNIFDLCVKWVSNTSSYVQGQRNRFIHSLSCACNRVGLDLKITEGHIKSNYDLEHKEIDHCISSAYFKNQNEHNSVKVVDIGIQEFKAPAWVMNFHDDVVINDIMSTTALLHAYKIPHNKIYEILKPIGFYYHMKNFIDLRKESLGGIMNRAVNALNSKIAEETDALTLQYVSAENIIEDLIDVNFEESAIATSFKELDAALRGGLLPGNFYGVIGVGGTFKSILVQFFCFIAALRGKASLYLCGEMTRYQFYERLVLMVLNTNLFSLLQEKKLTKETMTGFIREMNEVIHNNIIFVSGNGFNEQNVLATIDNVKAKQGKKVSMVIIDGVTQMDPAGLQEIPASINNTKVCKEIAKNAHGEEGVVVLGLMHISGLPNKLLRDTGTVCRGGVKTLANMDGYFSTSLLASDESNSLENQGGEIIYLPGKFFLKFYDKRNNAGTVNMIINVHEDLRLTVETTETNKYEIKLSGR